MKLEELETRLRSTLADGRVSRSEERALHELFREHADDDQKRGLYRKRIFEVAESALAERSSREVLEWVEDVVRVLDRPSEDRGALAEAHFSPGLDCLQKINDLIHGANRFIDICVFTITDNRISDQIERAHRRGVTVRIITDNDKSEDRGSDIDRLERAGIEARVDRTEHHMHHKFAIFDRKLLLTGSYNWTRSAAEHNQENLVVLDHPPAVGSFSRVFDELWARFG